MKPMLPNNPARPCHVQCNQTGLTIRQEFARTAMQAMMPLYWATDGAWTMEGVAEGAVQMADALIAELNKPNP